MFFTVDSIHAPPRTEGTFLGQTHDTFFFNSHETADAEALLRASRSKVTDHLQEALARDVRVRGGDAVVRVPVDDSPAKSLGRVIAVPVLASDAKALLRRIVTDPGHRHHGLPVSQPIGVGETCFEGRRK